VVEGAQSPLLVEGKADARVAQPVRRQRWGAWRSGWVPRRL